jgi:hypothetical protein
VPFACIDMRGMLLCKKRLPLSVVAPNVGVAVVLIFCALLAARVRVDPEKVSVLVLPLVLVEVIVVGCTKPAAECEAMVLVTPLIVSPAIVGVAVVAMPIV